MKTGMDAAGLTGGNSMVGAIAGGIKGGANAWNKEGGAKDTLKNSSMGSAVRAAATALKSMVPPSENGSRPQSYIDRMGSTVKAASQAMKTGANVIGDGLSRIHQGPMTGSTGGNYSSSLSPIEKGLGSQNKGNSISKG